MKRILIFLFIATFSVTGLFAQDKEETQARKQAQDLKVYQQQQEQEFQTAIREQTQLHIREAAQRMETRKNEVQQDLETRREQLMNRPAGMTPLSEEVRSRLNL